MPRHVSLQMRSKIKQTKLIVASHLPSAFPTLGKPFQEIMRISDSKVLTNMAVISHVEGLKSELESWSEYGAFWSGFPWHERIKTVGLLHYRCMLDLEGGNLNYSVLPLTQRNHFFMRQLQFLRRVPIDSILVSQPLVFDFSNWSQFIACAGQTRNLESLFSLTCKEFDLLVGGVDSEDHLKSTNHFYSRNMFIAPINFAADWWVISRRLADFLDSRQPKDVDPRWAAYILERLFSVYVDKTRSIKQGTFIANPIVFFK